jgi:hypothetical protein
MAIKTIDLVATFLSCFDDNGKINKSKYLNYVEQNKKYFKFILDYSISGNSNFSTSNAFDGLHVNFERDRNLYEKWRQEYYLEIDRIYSEVSKAFNKDINIDYCILIGFYNANGWTDIVDGKELPIVALDYVVHPTLGIVLAHELVHIFNKSDVKINEDNILDVLFYEGLAVYLTKKLNPGYEDNIYLSNFDKSWYDSWVAWYKDNKYELLKIKEDAQCFVQGQHRNKEFPARIAYYAGFNMINDFVEEIGLQGVVNLKIEEIRKKVKSYFTLNK